MHLRSWRLAHVLALTALVAVAPSCGSNKKNQPPIISNNIPANLATVSRSPLIVFQFDREMDPAFLNTTYILFNIANTNTSVSGYAVETIPALNEVHIYPTVLLDKGQSYDVFCLGTVQSAAGVQMGSAQGITITVEASSNIADGTSMTFTKPTGGPGTNSGEIALTWSAAMETLVSPAGPAAVGNYDIYVSLVSQEEDLLATTPPAKFTSPSTTGTTITGLLPNTPYFIKVVPRDGEGNVLQTDYSQTMELTATSQP